MNLQQLKQESEQRLHDITGIEPTTIATFLDGKDQRRQQLGQLVRADETDNAEFYRELGDR